MTLPPLLSPEFLSWLELLRRRLHFEIRSGGSGLWNAKARGNAAEFQEHRAYHPGDDIRRLDWSVFARTGEPMLKSFESEEEIELQLVLDSSASLDFGVPSKFDIARRLAAALSYLSLNSAGRVQLRVTPSPLLATESPAHIALAVLPKVRGNNGFWELVKQLERLAAHGHAELWQSIEHVLRRSSRPCALVVISDFLAADPERLMATLARARGARHELTLIQVLSPGDLTPELEGDVMLEDAETSEQLELWADESVLTRYFERLSMLCQGLERWAREHHCRYLRTLTSEPLATTLEHWLSHSSP